jgi:hypothetical protein
MYSSDPALAHIMKQINALKCENLELKKMISANRGSSKSPHFSARKSNKKVSISDYDGRSGRSNKASASILKSSVGSKSRSAVSRNCSRNTKHSQILSNTSIAKGCVNLKIGTTRN